MTHPTEAERVSARLAAHAHQASVERAEAAIQRWSTPEPTSEFEAALLRGASRDVSCPDCGAHTSQRCPCGA